MSDTELLPKPKVGSEPAPAVQRIEVFSGSGRRRRWTAEQKALIVAETFVTGEVSAVARRHGLTPQQLFTWRREVQRVRAGASRMAFAPVVLETARSCAGAEPMGREQSVSSLAIEIIIGAATVRVPPGTEPAALQLVLRALTTTP